MNFSKKTLSQTVTQICLAAGVDHIVISPGSRNAPLTIGFSEHPEFSCFSIVDERCAGFFAMGMAQQLKKPVALVCTSGSALLNYYPAVAEAYYSNIPLVVISADRPKHLVDVGDGQTIQQENVYGKHILYSANCREGKEYQLENENEIVSALHKAIHKQGPVHINVPFSEPLYETTHELSKSIDMDGLRTHFMEKPPQILNEKVYSKFIEDWNRASRKMVLVGTVAPHEIDEHFIEFLGSEESILVFTETTSNLHHPNFFPAIDKMIMPLKDADLESLQPDLLLTFGGMVVSKRIKAILRDHQPQAHYHIDPNTGYDTFFCLKHHFKTPVNEFYPRLFEDHQSVSSDYRSLWLQKKKYRREAHERYLKRIPFSDFMVFSILFETIPANVLLQLANSATVRYSQLFDLKETLEVFCNRGTSGIDGSTSTAVGAAHILDKQTVFITGDLSFFYDSNALWNNYMPENFRIIIVNNAGGGIFRILPKAKDAQHFETFFETQHQLTAQHLANMFGFEYVSATDEITLRDALKGFYENSKGPKILEVFTPSIQNDQVLKDYFKFIA